MQTFIMVKTTIYLDFSTLIFNLVNEMKRIFAQMFQAIQHQVNLFDFIIRSGLLTNLNIVISAEMLKY